MRMPHQPIAAAIALGSNVGDRLAHIRGAIVRIAALPRTSLVRVSEIRETSPVGDIAQGAYLNAAAVVSTRLTPGELLAGLLEIEREHGRDRAREVRWGPRTLDLDLILFGDVVVNEPGLIVPHPRMHEREFVLGPLAEISPGWVVPGLGLNVRGLLERLPHE